MPFPPAMSRGGNSKASLTLPLELSTLLAVPLLARLAELQTVLLMLLAALLTMLPVPPVILPADSLAVTLLAVLPMLSAVPSAA